MLSSTIRRRACLIGLCMGLAVAAAGARAHGQGIRPPGLRMAESAVEADTAGRGSGRLDDAVASTRELIERSKLSIVDPIVSAYAVEDAGAAGDAPRRVDFVAAPVSAEAQRRLEAALQIALAAEDPLEPFNRLMFGLNNGVRTTILNPITEVYLRLATPPVQAAVRRFFANLREPLTLLSNVIEGRMSEAGIAAARFGINSTAGALGFYDPATRLGYPANPRDLEEALCVYGIPSGPYMVLPVFGAATVRDAAGRVATVVAYYEAMGAAIYVPYRLTDIAVRSIDTQIQIDRLNATTSDPYAAQRVLYLSLRALDCGQRARAESEYFPK
jgi:phospholipid-binding lipoprotein MlaA